MITVATGAEPTIAVDHDMPNMVAQEWVAREHIPLVILDPSNGQPVQSVLAYENSEGSVVMAHFWGVIDLTEAVRVGRKVLNGS
jgi:hypothetical protein